MTSGQWRAVPGYEGAYEVSDLGQVRTLRHGHHREAAKTHCPAGHAYDEVNVSIGRRSDGHTFRRCRVCLVESTRRSRERKRAAA